MANPNVIAPLAFGAFFAWRIFRRIRRNFGRHRLQPKRAIYRICLYSALTLFFGFLAVNVATQSGVLAGLAVGVLAGAALGWLGIHLTKFESTDEGLFYTPNAYLGIGLTVLFIGRIFYRYLALGPDAGHPAARLADSMTPLTFLTFGLLAGYYIVYFAGLLWRSRSPQNRTSSLN